MSETKDTDTDTDTPPCGLGRAWVRRLATIAR